MTTAIYHLHVMVKTGKSCLYVHQVGQKLSDLTEKTFDDKILPYLIEAAHFVGVDPTPFQIDLQQAMLGKDPGLDQLEKVQMMLRHKLGTVSLIEQAAPAVSSISDDATIADDYMNVIVLLRKKGQRKLLVQAMNEVRHRLCSYCRIYALTK